MSLERKIESSIFLCIPRDLNILGKSCTTFVIVKIVRNLSRGRSPCQRMNHVKSGVIYFSAFIFSYDTIHVSGTIHTWDRGLTRRPLKPKPPASSSTFSVFFLNLFLWVSIGPHPHTPQNKYVQFLPCSLCYAICPTKAV